MYALKIVFKTKIAEILETDVLQRSWLEIPVADTKGDVNPLPKIASDYKFCTKRAGLKRWEERAIGATFKASRLKVKITSKTYIGSKQHIFRYV